MICPRCQHEVTVSTCSYFSTEDICLECKADERGCPNFQKAYDAETAAVRNHDYNFAGIGLAPEDRAYLAAARQSRRTA